MPHDIFIDCPQCNHTIKASSELVGVFVECPDCGHNFEVPDIRDGLNVRYRNTQNEIETVAPPPAHSMLDDLTHLEDRMRSLLRRQREQINQMNLLAGNCTLLQKQLTIVNEGTAKLDIENEAPAFISEEASSRSVIWMRLSIACGVMSVLASLGVVIWVYLTH